MRKKWPHVKNFIFETTSSTNRELEKGIVENIQIEKVNLIMEKKIHEILHLFYPRLY